ncbi:DDE-type integrase/transposase/recombinase [Microbispora sitophila]|uniref:DDE-type integrase/transposase/recombinase n=1 Tax=Microbispora sitophila TaxID=2771537 RepID=UPI0021F786E9|nr:DDE-type integrase/transposase/recombinase [Microbispora sitophila]
MRELGLHGARRGKTIRTTVREDGHERAADLLRLDFTATHPEQRWVADFTCVMTRAGVVYVAFVVDVYSRAIVGWSAATTKRAKLVLDALDTRLWRRDRAGHPAGPGRGHHSDAGSQYTSFAFTATCWRRASTPPSAPWRRPRQHTDGIPDRPAQDRADQTP